MSQHRTRPAYVAAFAAAVMIAQQTAGKATRDALFLSHYPAVELPKVMVASAALSIAGVLGVSVIMQRLAPARVVPIAFVGSGALFAVEWVVVSLSPGVAAWMIYLHMAVFGGIVISGFWSVVNERFDPHSAKKAVARIAAAATFGGLLGGLSAERVAVLLEPRHMLLVLSVLNWICAIAVWAIGAPRRHHAAGVEEPSGPAAGLRILRSVPYLQKLALLVMVVAMTAALLDFALKAQAAQRLESGQTLMQFFALFYTATGLLTFVVQSVFARRVLERFGLDGAIALLPGLVLLSGSLAAAVTRMWAVALVRGVESVLANSFFRSGYELLYTPLAPLRKRATKAIIDVAFDRMGDAIGSAVIFLVLWLTPSELTVSTVLAVAAATAAIGLVVARTLHHGYVGALAESLRSGSVKLHAGEVFDATTRRTLSETTLALDRERLLAEIAALRTGRGDGDEEDARESGEAPTEADPEIARQVERLVSGREDRARRALAERPFDPRLVPFALPWLGHDALYGDARDALRDTADRAPGAIVDALLDPEQPAVVRRRLPQILSRADGPVAAAGLFAGLGDPGFDVRYHCGQALARLCVRNPRLAPPRDDVLTAAAWELEVEREVFEAHESELAEDSAWIDDILRARMRRGLEHVFTLLSLSLDREPLLLSLRALHSDDEGLRGTALEYLENVLPEEIHARLVPHLAIGGRPSKGAKRSPQQIVEELSASLDHVRIERASGGS